MKISETIKAIDIVLRTGEVPLIVGHSGIGKSQIVKDYACNNGYYFVKIDGNMLKEGEIGGLPVVEDYDIKNNDMLLKGKRTVYALHSKILEIDNASKKGEKILLFIDELNRCEHVVQQELMNIILDREINGYKMPTNTYIVGAMNPSSKYNGFEEYDYGVVEMDGAQEDRFTWLFIESSHEEWILWAKDHELEEEVIEFIQENEEFLHKVNSEDVIFPTPRSWERVSKIVKEYKNRKFRFDDGVFYYLLKGNLGAYAAQSFISYIKSHSNNIYSLEELLNYNDNRIDITGYIESLSPEGVKSLFQKFISYLKKNNHKSNDDLIGDNVLSVFINIFYMFPKDMIIGLLKELKKDDEQVFEKLLDDKNFISKYYDIYSLGV